MTMPLKYRRDPVKRREYLQSLCGNPDGQTAILPVLAIICEGSTCNEICPNYKHCEKAGTSLGLHFGEVIKE